MNHKAQGPNRRPVGSTADDEVIADLVIACDEAVRRGTDWPNGPNETAKFAELDPEARERLTSAKDCLHLIERVRQFRQTDTREFPTEAAGTLLQDNAYTAGGAIQRIGRFEIVRELGRGSHGVVFLARDPGLNREIALKVPRPEAILTPQLRSRFLREGKAAARLNHPNILAVHEAGEVGPICYLVQSYCSGLSLAAWLAKQNDPVPCELAARIVAEVADGVDHAHKQGVLHRDIKPANVMLEMQGAPDGVREKGGDQNEGTLRFVPKLTDFGLAKALDDDPNATATLGTLGTAVYMPPEQAAGQLSLVGPPSDVYSLGALLYEMITRRPPIVGANQLETLRLIANEEPQPVRQFRPGAPRELEAICLKCLEKSPDQRYTTAADLAADLRRFLSGDPVSASPQSRSRRALRRLRRQSVSVLIGFVTIAILAAGMLLCLLLIWSNRTEKITAQAASPLDPAAEYLDGIGRVSQAYFDAIANRGDVKTAVGELDAFLERHRPRPGQADYRGFEWHYLWRLCHPDQVARPFPKLFDLAGHKGEVYFATFSPDGKRIATGGQDHTGRIWDAQTGKLLQTLNGHTYDVNSIGFYPVAAIHLVVTASDDGTVRVWNYDSGKQERVLTGHKTMVVAAEFVIVEKREFFIVSGDQQGWLYIWDWPSGRQVRSLRPHGNRIHAIVPIRDCERFITTSADQSAKEWYAASWSTVRTHSFETPISAASCNLNGSVAAFSTSTPAGQHGYQTDAMGNVLEGRVILNDLSTGTPWLTLVGPPRLGYESVRFDPGRSALVAVSRSTERLHGSTHDVVVWDVPTQRWWDAVDPTPPGCWCAAFSPDGTRLATAGVNGLVEVWDSSALPAGTRLPGSLGDPDRPVGSIRYAPNGHVLMVSHFSLARPGVGDSLTLWDVSGPRPKALSTELTLEKRYGCTAAAFSRDGRLVAVSDLAFSGKRFTSEIRLLDTESRHEVARSSDYDGVCRSLVVSADGRTAVAAMRDEPPINARLYVWNVAQGAPKVFRASKGNHFLTTVLSPDGKLLATNEEQVELFEFPSMLLTGSLPIRLGNCGTIAFSPDGKTLAAGGEGGIIHLCDVATGTMQADLRSDGHAILSLAFSPDGTRLAAGLAGTPRVDLWNLKSGRRLAPLALPTDSQSVGDLIFSPDQHTLAAAAIGGTGCVFLFPLEPVNGSAN
jgi:serine/threonine protein kinase/WD40 repeat protein